MESLTCSINKEIQQYIGEHQTKYRMYSDFIRSNAYHLSIISSLNIDGRKLILSIKVGAGSCVR